MHKKRLVAITAVGSAVFLNQSRLSKSVVDATDSVKLYCLFSKESFKYAPEDTPMKATAIEIRRKLLKFKKLRFVKRVKHTAEIAPIKSGRTIRKLPPRGKREILSAVKTKLKRKHDNKVIAQ